MTQTAENSTLEPTPSPAWTENPSPTLTHTARPVPDRLAGMSESIDAIVRESGGEWHVTITEVGGDVLYARGEGDILHPASVIKVPIAMLFFAALENEVQPADLEMYLREHGTDGRSYDQLLQAMLVKSEEPAAESLRTWVGEKLRVDKILTEWQVIDTRIEPRQTTLLDLERLYSALYLGKWISAGARAYILRQMSEYTPNDDLRLGIIRSCQAEGEQFYNKRGTLTDERLIVGDTAIFERAGKLYFVGVFAYQARDPGQETTYERLESGMAEFARLFCRYFGDQP